MHNIFILKEKCSLVHMLFACKDASKHLHTRTMNMLDYYCSKNDCGLKCYRFLFYSYFIFKGDCIF